MTKLRRELAVAGLTLLLIPVWLTLAALTILAGGIKRS
jgi:hypothetical protein